MTYPIRILHVVTTMDYGGVETLLMELYRHIDRTKVQFDFLCHNTSEGEYCLEIKKLGGRIYSIKSANRCISSYIYKKQLKKFFAEHREYKIIHSHVNGLNGYVLDVAKKCDLSVRISHSHVANRKIDIFKNYHYYKSMKLINENATDFFACSDEAAFFLYSGKENVIFFKNAIDTKKFLFNIEKRNEVRNELLINGKLTFINIGRFTEEKNHSFIIDIFNEITKIQDNSNLLLIGDGPLKEKITQKVHDLLLDDKVIFLGNNSSVNNYLFASDVFLFPSLYEGLGIAAIEAQCSGLLTFASDRVPIEAKQSELIEFISLNESPKYWAERILFKLKTCSYLLNDKERYSNVIKNNGYDITEKAKWLQDFYTRRLNETIIK